MRRRTITPRHSSGEINVTPLIDVVMCLIIFYLMVGKLATDRKTPVKLPESSIGAINDPEVLVVNVVPVTPSNSSAGSASSWPAITQSAARVIVDSTEIPAAADLESMVRRRLAANPGLIVQLRAEQTFDYGVVAPVMQACVKGGATSVRLATQRAARGSPGSAGDDGAPGQSHAPPTSPEHERAGLGNPAINPLPYGQGSWILENSIVPGATP